uniref:Integrase catalytic domain-containing protein n=1 Tax=Dendroctonus ponderosae TaxID=77166 RepID=A0AAR5PUR1_DENPD
MGNLPKQRLIPTRPFKTTGLDYMGPVILKDRTTKNYKPIKAWICIFICFATKAIHLEMVSDLSTKSFLSCLKRFFSRRGVSAEIFCDNATNFVGAKNEIQKFLSKNKDTIDSSLNNDGIKCFIPPRAPHFGGLWEAGVRCVKFHLKRVIGSTPLTFEEYSTVLSQIEACLNSRPLSPMSSDPSDLNPLTPAHFLIGESLTSLPEVDYSYIPEDRLSKFQRTEKRMQLFWSRWSREYVPELQQRSKWKKNSSVLLKPDVMGLIKEDGLPSGC